MFTDAPTGKQNQYRLTILDEESIFFCQKGEYIMRAGYGRGQRDRVFERCQGKCADCGVRVGDRPLDLAYEFHHIDHDSSNTVDENLEVR
jgi:hypothetical protein